MYDRKRIQSTKIRRGNVEEILEGLAIEEDRERCSISWLSQSPFKSMYVHTTTPRCTMEAKPQGEMFSKCY